MTAKCMQLSIPCCSGTLLQQWTLSLGNRMTESCQYWHRSISDMAGTFAWSLEWSVMENNDINVIISTTIWLSSVTNWIINKLLYVRSYLIFTGSAFVVCEFDNLEMNLFVHPEGTCVWWVRVGVLTMHLLLLGSSNRDPFCLQKLIAFVVSW